uniref:Uncharacterized protein n=1 Tax=Anguilla anguilla TaxID=7936 RepID=A0A0E9WC30_ANGAN
MYILCKITWLCSCLLSSIKAAINTRQAVCYSVWVCNSPLFWRPELELEQRL